jgi:hypothetical protein
MNPEQIIQKIDNLEKQLPHWEKWLLVCYGASFTMFINAMIRLVERSYLNQAFVFTAEELTPMGASGGIIPESVSASIGFSLTAPGWTLVCWFFVLAMLYPGILLSIHSEWRKVRISKRLNLIFGFFLASWVVLLSLGAQDPNNVADGFNFLLIVSAIALGIGYWRSRRKQKSAEETFP